MSAHLDAMLQESAAQAELARIAAGMSRGATRRQYLAYAHQHHRNALALSDALYGAPSEDIMAMSDDELAALLTA